jgi:subtilase family serine protease
LSARLKRVGLAGLTAALMAVLTVGNAAASIATPSGSTASLHQMYVNPDISAAPDAGTSSASGNYNLRVCQVGLSVGQCYDPYQMRTAYGVSSLIANGNDGTGKKIVIIDAFDDPYLQSNFDTFNSYYGLPAQTITQVDPGGATGYNTGWAEEEQLDVDWAHAIAPGAQIVMVHGKSNSDQDLIAAANYAINNNLGDVISMSFGESDQCLGADLTNQWHQAFVNATKKGITLFASSGDQGAAQPSCDGNSWIQSTSSPASDPLVTGVGGTELHAADFCLPQLGCDPNANPAPGTWLSEIAWNEGPTGDFSPYFGATEATGGGYSTVWSEPAYQQGTIHGGKMRGEPDVAYNAAILHGVLVPLNLPGLAVGFYRFGGTSAGAPQWAALTAIADQMAGHDYGFINSALYKIGQSSGSYAAAFHDVTSGQNNSVEFDNNNNEVDISGFNAGSGWDAVTGLGSPKAGGLFSQLAQQWAPGQATAAINNSKNG